MNLQINWRKVFLDIYPENLIKQFLRVVVPLYFFIGFFFGYLLMNTKTFLYGEHKNLETTLMFYFTFPIFLPILISFFLLSSIHIVRHNNPFLLSKIGFKYLLVYGLNAGMIVLALFCFLIYFFVMNIVFKIV